MGRGVKLGLGGLGFLLTNGTTFLALKNSFHSPDSLKNPNLHLAGGGKAQTKKEKTLKLDFAKKKENDLPIVSAKQDTLPEVKLELKNQKNELDVPKGLFDYASNNVSSKVKDILLEIEKENRVNEQKQQIQNFEDLAKNIKNIIPKVFEKLISKIPKFLPSENERRGDGQSNSTDSSKEQVPAVTTFPDTEGDNGRDIQEQQLTGTGEGGETEVKEMGNCVIDPSTIKEILQVRDLESEYYFVSCTNTDSDENYYVETFDGKRWGGAFPRILFRSKGLSERTRLNIKAKAIEDGEIQNEEDDYVFVFEFYSDQFNNFEEGFKVIGDFKYENEEEKIASNDKGAIVKLTKPKNIEDKIYLLTNLDNSDSD